ncbi:lipopolysaccharide-induced tumor necrosis factor-alpha factor homolog [Protopterus annectens]|uniref:lipopolysaccharide-induced tumor necrosis factor-alpha factor homolog n=1 Tax=Protopterus annectens TaxID=7888 RepID=UPI001CFACBA9|nr:lipopolysaccharide-induced tumor necrosis factor-alpha factor homolog [Protopterus annectens]
MYNAQSPQQYIGNPAYQPNPAYPPAPGFVPTPGYAPPAVIAPAPTPAPAPMPSININVNQNQDHETGNATKPAPTGVVTNQPIVVAPPMVFKGTPVQMTCPSCKRDIMTQPVYKAGGMTWLICGILGIFGFWLCCWIPFVVDSCKDATHYCPQCRTIVGSYKPL